MRARVVAAGLIAVWSLGCFVLEELDSAMATVQVGSPDSQEESTPNPTGYWEDAETLDPHLKDKDIVRCDLHGATSFMREVDCRARGGVPGA